MMAAVAVAADDLARLNAIVGWLDPLEHLAGVVK